MKKHLVIVLGIMVSLFLSCGYAANRHFCLPSVAEKQALKEKLARYGIEEIEDPWALLKEWFELGEGVYCSWEATSVPLRPGSPAAIVQYSVALAGVTNASLVMLPQLLEKRVCSLKYIDQLHFVEINFGETLCSNSFMSIPVGFFLQFSNLWQLFLPSSYPDEFPTESVNGHQKLSEIKTCNTLFLPLRGISRPLSVADSALSRLSVIPEEDGSSAVDQESPLLSAAIEQVTINEDDEDDLIPHRYDKYMQRID